MNQPGTGVEHELGHPGVAQRVAGRATRVPIEQQGERRSQDKPVPHRGHPRARVPSADLPKRGGDPP